MFRTLRRLFGRLTPADMADMLDRERNATLFEAKRELSKHENAIEYHRGKAAEAEATAKMLRQRIDRLEKPNASNVTEVVEATPTKAKRPALRAAQ